MLRNVMAIILTLVAIFAAGWLALRRGDIPYNTLETLYSVEGSQFLNLKDGLKIHYTDTGPKDGLTIVLVHGYTSSLHTWADWKKDLEQDFRVIALDLPGHGLSRAEGVENATIKRFAAVIDELLSQLDVETYTLVGHSMGGYTAWMYALNYPEHVQGLVLVGASGWNDTHESTVTPPLMTSLMKNSFTRGLLKDLDMSSTFKSGLKKSYADPEMATEELVDRYVSLARAPGHRDVLIELNVNRNDIRAEEAGLNQITVPTLVLWGDQDLLVPVGDAGKFAAVIPNATVQIYEDIGHMVQEEIVEQSLIDMRTFMMDVEWNAIEEEDIIPAGDPRLVEDRPPSQ